MFSLAVQSIWPSSFNYEAIDELNNDDNNNNVKFISCNQTLQTGKNISYKLAFFSLCDHSQHWWCRS